MKRVALVVISLAFWACGGAKKKEAADLSATVVDLSATSTPDGGMTSNTPGPGATLVCETSGKNAFLTYGATKLVEINEAIFANVGTELAINGATNLGTSLELVTDMSTPSMDSSAVFKAKLGAFLVWAYGGPSSFQYTDGVMYDGIQDMVAAHKGLAITQAQYDYFLGMIIAPALASSGIANGTGDGDNDVVSCFAPVLTNPTFVASIVNQ
jgi:hypothetical protein